MEPTCPLEVVGVVRTARSTTATTPIQSALNRREKGVVEVGEAYVEGLVGLDGFDHVWLITWLHQRDARVEGPPPMTQVPFLLQPEQQSMGIFATRGPRRVNAIGLSLVDLDAIVGGRLHFSGVDLVDGTPVVDIKPYVKQFDRPPGDPRCGWFDQVAMQQGITPADLRPGAGPGTDVP